MNAFDYVDYEEPESKPIGEYIRAQREQRDMSQTELARRAGISRNHLHGVEHGKSEPSWRVVRALCDVLGVEPWEAWEPEPDTEAIDLLRNLNDRAGMALIRLNEILQILLPLAEQHGVGLARGGPP